MIANAGGVPPEPPGDAEAPKLEVGHCVRAIAGERVSGDAFSALPWASGVVVAVADGLGHGSRAAAAAAAFMVAIAAGRDRPLDVMLTAAHHDLKKTRGAVAAVARFDPSRGQVEIASVGNIATILYPHGAKPLRPISPPGVLGGVLRSLRPQTFPFHVGDVLLMFSDGLRSTFEPDFGPATSVDDMAASLVRRHAKGTDDVVCAIVRAAGVAAALEEARSVPIRGRGDAEFAAAAARAFAREVVALPARASWEVSIVAAELATNILKFAKEGELRFRYCKTPRECLVVEAHDQGRGIVDVDAATRDGFSEGALRSADRPRRDGQGLGVGLGSLHRMMDRVEIHSAPGRGTRVVATKYRG